MKSDSESTAYYRWLFQRIENEIGQKVAVLGPAAQKFVSFLEGRKSVLAVPEDISLSRNGRLSSMSFDTAICLNALELAASDSVLLQQIHDLLLPDGRAIFLVPSLPWMSRWLDASGKIRHRYSKKQIFKKLDQHRFHVTDYFFFNAFGIFFPQHRTDLERNGLMDRFACFWNDLEKKLRLPFGRSLVVITKKKFPARG